MELIATRIRVGMHKCLLLFQECEMRFFSIFFSPRIAASLILHGRARWRDKFSKVLARKRPRDTGEQRGWEMTGRVIFRIDDGIDIGPVRQ